MKIGYSKDPVSRLRNLQTSNPLKLKLIGLLPGSFSSEKEFHLLFKKFKTNGEWFRYDGQLKSCLIALNDPNFNKNIRDIKSFQKAGMKLQIIQKCNKKDKDSNFNKKVKRFYLNRKLKNSSY